MSNASHAYAINKAIYDKLTVDLAATGAGVPVGLGVAPDPVPDLYAIVDPMDGTIRGDLDDAHTRVKHVVQVRSVGNDVLGASWVQDAVRDSLLDGTLSVSGIRLMQTVPEVSGMVSRDDDADPFSRFAAFDRFAFYFDTRP